MRIGVNVRKILPITLGNINDHGQHFTFCCLGHSDLNYHFKNLNISNTSLTLGEPDKPKYTLTALSSKHDSMCHGKYVLGKTTQNPEFT